MPHDASIYRVEDPATGEMITLKELARRHRVPYPTVQRRNREGKTGADLVKKPDQRYQVGGRHSKTGGIRQLPPTRQQIAQEVLATPDGRLASTLFRDFGRSA
ncbi:hypothetical protein [Halomonas lysinitropha]|uniref:Uncharacterized protein n=1 Tax=Halomonas lysinitropha TaxID=2607506 RepID=A0A5K1IB14_9GAMM|nr:hypothetical protein [Halomonas lysinitropha]VVZ96462.1 hypothetical protein HALO32_02562 [Halomonas lysinitropha]